MKCVDVFTDVDWAKAVNDKQSTSSYFPFVGDNLVTLHGEARSRMLLHVQMQKSNLEI